jgi:hypothetical protein
VAAPSTGGAAGAVVAVSVKVGVNVWVGAGVNVSSGTTVGVSRRSSTGVGSRLRTNPAAIPTMTITLIAYRMICDTEMRRLVGGLLDGFRRAID